MLNNPSSPPALSPDHDLQVQPFRTRPRTRISAGRSPTAAEPENQTDIRSPNTRWPLPGRLARDESMSVFRTTSPGPSGLNPKTNSARGSDGRPLSQTTLRATTSSAGPTPRPTTFTCHNFNGAENTTAVSHILPITAQQRPGQGRKKK